jgi:hypothetical protein
MVNITCSRSLPSPVVNPQADLEEAVDAVAMYWIASGRPAHPQDWGPGFQDFFDQLFSWGLKLAEHSFPPDLPREGRIALLSRGLADRLAMWALLAPRSH